jgi:hypothetical protein
MSGLCDFPFPLDKGYVAHLQLPHGGLTAQDASRLAGFVRTLVTEGETRAAELDALARDFVWSCPNIPQHPTAQRLVEFYTLSGEGKGVAQVPVPSETDDA